MSEGGGARVWLVQWFKSTSVRNDFGIPVRNFDKVTDGLYRGALPGPAGYRAMVGELGVRRVCCMIENAGNEDRRRAFDGGVEEWRHIPFSDRDAPDAERVRDWLAYIRTATTDAPVYAHCRGGRHRTGVLVGVYRVAACGWTKEQAVKEMLRYGWYGALGHRPLLEWFLHAFDPKDFAPPDAPPVGSDLSGLAQQA